MKLKTANFLADALFELGFDGEVYEDYSSRGGYKEIAGIVVNRLEDLIPSAAYVVSVEFSEDFDEGEIKEFIDDLTHLRSDSLGKQIIVY